MTVHHMQLLKMDFLASNLKSLDTIELKVMMQTKYNLLTLG